MTITNKNITLLDADAICDLPTFGEFENSYTPVEREAIIANIILMKPDVCVSDSHSGQIHLCLTESSTRTRIKHNLLTYCTYYDSGNGNDSFGFRIGSAFRNTTIDTYHLKSFGFKNDPELKKMMDNTLHYTYSKLNIQLEYKLFLLYHNNLKYRYKLNYQALLINNITNSFLKNGFLTENEFKWCNLVYSEGYKFSPDIKL